MNTMAGKRKIWQNGRIVLMTVMGEFVILS